MVYFLFVLKIFEHIVKNTINPLTRLNIWCNILYVRRKNDEYVQYAYLYNLLYLETYLYMEKNHLLYNRLFLVDCTGLSLEEETRKVKEIIDIINAKEKKHYA